uniref:Transmembrane protein n=1 Tax=Angiostrongylus cantonensis TaxID=6313 RepID=A0A0K0DLX3_ANGCA
MLRFHTFLDFPCYAPCFSLHWKTTTSYSRTLRGLRITLEISNMMEVFVEVRKMAITDVLSFIGGGTSLFLGCSCVTLMETFIFLLKLVLQSINKETCERIELENGKRCYTSIFMADLLEIFELQSRSCIQSHLFPTLWSS